jgi:hypothetical protein
VPCTRPHPMVTIDDDGMWVHSVMVGREPGRTGTSGATSDVPCRPGTETSKRSAVVSLAFQCRAPMPTEDQDTGSGWSTRADALPCVPTRAVHHNRSRNSELGTRNSELGTRNSMGDLAASIILKPGRCSSMLPAPVRAAVFHPVRQRYAVVLPPRWEVPASST